MSAQGHADTHRALAGLSLFLATVASLIVVLADVPETRGDGPAKVALLAAPPVALAAVALALQRPASRARTAAALAGALMCAHVALAYDSVGLRYAPAAIFMLFAAALARDRAG